MTFIFTLLCHTGNDTEAEIHEVDIWREDADDETGSSDERPKNGNKPTAELIDEDASDRTCKK